MDDVSACVDHSRTNPSFSAEEAAESRLRRNSYLALQNVSCEYHDGVLFLHGWVSTYYLKQVACSVVADLEGVHRVVDQIDVSTSRPG